MSDGEQKRPGETSSVSRSEGRTGTWLIALAVVALLAGLLGRVLAPTQQQTATAPAQPIVQIVRRHGFPSIADDVARLCPSIVKITTGSDAAAGNNGAMAFVISADGWLLTSGPLANGAQRQALLSNGEKAAIDEVRSDPVSGLSVAHASATTLTPLSFSDQSFARVGDFGFSLEAPNGSGCSAQWAMIGGDFLGDANTKGVLFRLQPGSSQLAAGSPFFGDDGAVLGVASESQAGALLPGPIAASIVDELIRGTPSPIARFGFRAVDFSPDLATRVGNARARGAGVALIQPNSSADKAGLRAGDIIVAVDGSPVSSASELARDLDAEAGEATLQVARGDEQIQLKVAQSAD